MTRYAIVNVEDKKVVLETDGLPKSLSLPNRKRIVAPVGPEHVGVELDGYRFVEIERLKWKQPGQYYKVVDTVSTLTRTKLTLTRTWTRLPQQEIDQTIVNARATMITSFLKEPQTAVLFAIAQRLEPTLTKQQFAALVEEVWP